MQAMLDGKIYTAFPCPACGQDPVIVVFGSVWCCAQHCGFVPDSCSPTRGEAIRAWNDKVDQVERQARPAPPVAGAGVKVVEMAAATAQDTLAGRPSRDSREAPATCSCGHAERYHAPAGCIACVCRTAGPAVAPREDRGAAQTASKLDWARDLTKSTIVVYCDDQSEPP
jgi:hypothetical protein